ncbi:MAG TPA: 16S rRNA (cytidine(1402)-2'-O)-methyltransferase [Bryobacteraceae bacterium]|nr:16S rRNA (cytidine(1402)-2'-O)-methyltransferase [Bryobacteraceae bacterium]
MSGTLYIVATPIGNLEDITRRAARILAEVDAIACEDTRQTSKLLAYLGIERPLLAFHDHNERERAADLTSRLLAGASLALVSDAGTPLISDPGYRLIEAATAAGVPVVPIPGACAAVAALCASGLAIDSFYFGGFFPPKTSQRRKLLEGLRGLPATLVFYEAPHRILETLSDIAEVFPARAMVVARELTKLHEEFLRGTAIHIHATLAARASIKGEFTILLGKGPDASPPGDRPVNEAVAELEAAGVSRMDAIKAVARERGVGKREVYRVLEKS